MMILDCGFYLKKRDCVLKPLKNEIDNQCGTGDHIVLLIKLKLFIEK